MRLARVPLEFLSWTLYRPGATPGTLNVTCVSDQLAMLAAEPPKSTLPVAPPNPLPAMVTFMPECPTVGPMEPTSGAVAEAVDCHTATVWAGSVNPVTGLLPVPVFTETPTPPRRPAR